MASSLISNNTLFNRSLVASVIRMAATRVSLGRWGRVIQPKGHWGPCNEVGSYITDTTTALIYTLNLMGSVKLRNF